MNCETYDYAIAGTPFAVLRKLIKIKIGQTFNKYFSLLSQMLGKTMQYYNYLHARL